MRELLWGKYRAEVVDNDDPLKRGRVLVKSEDLMPNQTELGWAESCFMPGQFTVPRKGDFVWIEFEQGDINLPIWVGIMPTRDYVKSYLFREYGDRVHYDPYIKIYCSNNHPGIHFRDNDIKGKKELLIKDEAGSTINLNSVNGNIETNPDNVGTGTNGNSGRVSPGSPKSPKTMEVERT